VPPGAVSPFTTSARPTTQIAPQPAKVNWPILFRRALKLVNGNLGNIVAPGSTVATENPVYVHGHSSANAAGFGNPHVSTSIVGDAVVILSRAWNDDPTVRRMPSADGRAQPTRTCARALSPGKDRPFRGRPGWPRSGPAAGHSATRSNCN
jgi:hypothetical protein